MTSSSATRFRKINPDGSGRFSGPVGTVPPPQPPKPTRTQSTLEYVLFGVFALLVILGGVAVWSMYSPSQRAVPNHIAAGLAADRVNILVIGVGGDSHPGGGKDLADSIMLVSLKPSTRQAAIISIPRDFWVPVGRYGTHRINQAHAIGGQSGYPGGGPGLLIDTVSNMFGQPIHGYVRVDFAAFEKVVDALGGIDVNNPRSFYDYLFHDGFVAGPHHLDGKRALAYARYRYIIGPDGDNFSRELRQQQVIDAVRAKFANRSPQDLLRLVKLATSMSDYTQTNLSTAQMISLYGTFHAIDRKSVRNVSLKPFTEIFDVTRLSDPGQAVRTRTGDFRELRAVAATVFNGTGQISTSDQIQVK